MNKFENLPETKDPHILNIMEIGEFSLPVFNEVAPELLLYMSVLNANICIRHGNSSFAPFFHLVSTLVCVMVTRELKLSDKISRAAFKLSKRYSGFVSQASVYFIIGVFIHHWKNSLESSDKWIQKAYQLCRQAGMVNHAGATIFFTSLQKIFCSRKNLTDIIQDNENHYALFLELGLTEIASYQKLIVSYLSTIYGPKNQMERLDLDFQLREFEQKTLPSCGGIIPGNFYLFMAIIQYSFGDVQKAYHYTKRNLKIVKSLLSSFGSFFHTFFFLLAYYGIKEKLSFWKKVLIAPTIIFNRALLRHYAKENPHNFRTAYLLVKAESAKAQGKFFQANQFYEQAISAAEERGWPFIIALCYQCAALFHLQTKELHAAKLFFREACDVLKKWGAFGLAKQLESKYSQFFEKEIMEFTGNSETLESYPKKENKEPIELKKEAWLEETFSKLSQSLSPESLVQLDIQALLKSSYAILGEPHPQRLLQKFMGIVLEHSGADRVCFIQEQYHELMLAAEQLSGDKEASLLKDMSVHHYHRLPSSIINYVSRMRELVLIQDTSQDTRFQGSYLKGLYGDAPKSLLVLPILYQQRALGILYLENSKISEAFTKERRQFLDLLVAQVALALNNTAFYANSRKSACKDPVNLD